MQGFDVLLLRPHEITDVIDIAKAIDLVEQGYREAQGFPIINAPRRRVHSRTNVRISSFPGGVDGLGVIGSLTRGEQVKNDATSQDYPYREHPVYLLWNAQTARLQCIMIGEITEKRIGFSSLMALRTAATSGVSFRHLARKDAKTAGVYGAGGQALHKVLALQNERAIETYKVFSRTPENRREFCERNKGHAERIGTYILDSLGRLPYFTYKWGDRWPVLPNGCHHLCPNLTFLIVSAQPRDGQSQELAFLYFSF